MVLAEGTKGNPPPPFSRGSPTILGILLVDGNDDLVTSGGGTGGQVVSRTNLRIHFVHHHMWDTIVILDMVNCHHPRCPKCDIFVLWG